MTEQPSAQRRRRGGQPTPEQPAEVDPDEAGRAWMESAFRRQASNVPDDAPDTTATAAPTAASMNDLIRAALGRPAA